MDLPEEQRWPEMKPIQRYEKQPHLVRKNTTISVTIAIPSAFSLSLQMQDNPHHFKPLTTADCIACPEHTQVQARITAQRDKLPTS